MAMVASEDFKKWFNGVLVDARKMAAETLSAGEQLHPHLLVFSYNNQMAYVPVTMEDKDFVAGLHKHLGSKAGAIAGAVLVTETWMLEISKEKDPEEYERRARSKGSIDKHPDRVEAVMWNAIRGEMQLMAFAKVTREGNKGILQETTIMDPAVTHAEGRMVVDGERDKKAEM